MPALYNIAHLPPDSASAEVDNARLRFCIDRRARLRGQLQHGRVLTYAQTSEQHDLPVWELKRIVMYTWLFLVDLPEPGHFRSKLSSRRPFREGNALDILLERDLRAGQKAHRHVWFSDSGKTTGD
jgi:hypothetical protein